MSAEAYDFFKNIGMDVYAQNVSTLYKPTNILNMLFGVRYLHAYNADIPENLYLDLLEIVDTDTGVSIYENRYCLPLAFAASRDALSLDMDGLSGRPSQNEMLRTLLGEAKGTTYRTEADIADAYGTLAAGGMQITKFENDHIIGTVKSEGDSLLFTSIPADGGWTVYVDGVQVNTVTVFGYLLGTHLAAGEHTIEMRYTSPGYTAGLAISIVSAVILILYATWEYRKRRKAT